METYLHSAQWEIVNYFANNCSIEDLVGSPWSEHISTFNEQTDEQSQRCSLVFAVLFLYISQVS